MFNREINSLVSGRNYRFIQKLRLSEVKHTLKKMKSWRVVGLDDIPAQVLKGLGDMGLVLLIKFNEIIDTRKMPHEWMICTLVFVYKN